MKTRLQALLVVGWLLALAVPATPAADFSKPWHLFGTQPTPSAEEATPDCGAPPVSADAAAERARHLHQLGVDSWHKAGFTGKGVKVAILDSGFRGYRAYLGKALPAQVMVRSFRADGNMEAKDSQHGILCAEVVHALAPDAELLLATWESDKPEQFLQAVRWARQQGARVVTCSVIMPSWSDGEGGGAIHESLTQALGPGSARGDVLCFASAGNTARRHWCGTFHDGGDGFHTWSDGRRDNIVKPWGKERVSVEMYWQRGCRFHLTVFDAATGSEVGHSNGVCGPNRCHAVVRFQPVPGHRYSVRVQKTQGPVMPFHMVALGGDLTCVMPGGSIAFPADGPEVIAVGAVDGEGRRAAYSSCGPNSRTPKPDLVAPVPFPSLCRDRPFTGTSAAAPQAAALAALCLSQHPEWTAAEVRKSLRKWARDLGPPGHDWETGYGLVTLPAPTK